MTKPTTHVEMWGDRKATVVTAPKRTNSPLRSVAFILVALALLGFAYWAYFNVGPPLTPA